MNRLQKSVFFIVFFLCLGSFAAINALATGINPTPSPYLSTGFPQVVVVSGTNYEMGMQYGRQTAHAIVHNVAIFKSKLYDKHGSDNVTKDMQVWNYYLMEHDPTLKDWIQGISDGCSQKGYYVSYLDLILLMYYPTELWSRPKAPYPAMTGIQTQGTSKVALKGGMGIIPFFFDNGSKTVLACR